MGQDVPASYSLRTRRTQPAQVGGSGNLVPLFEFELRWYRYGGGPATEILTRFGLDPRTFFLSVLDFLERDPPTPVCPQVIDAMKTVTHKRLWLLGP